MVLLSSSWSVFLARLPQNFMQEFSAKQTRGGGGLLIFLVEIAALIAVILGLDSSCSGCTKSSC